MACINMFVSSHAKYRKDARIFLIKFFIYFCFVFVLIKMDDEKEGLVKNEREESIGSRLRGWGLGIRGRGLVLGLG